MSRPHILLVNPWIHDFAAYDMWARPMGLLVLATRLRHMGWEPILMDCLDADRHGVLPVKRKPHAHGPFVRTPIAKPAPLSHVPRTFSRYGMDPDAVEGRLASMPAPAAIFVTGIITYWYPGVQAIIELLRDAFPGVPLLLGGIYPTLMPDHARRHSGADEVLQGPGETILSDALFRHTGISSNSSEENCALEFSPALDLLREVPFIPVLTSRGCPFRCAYCASGKIAPFFVRREPDSVVEELATAATGYGVHDVALYDDAFLVRARDHALPILVQIAERVPGLRWHSPNGLHASELDRQVAGAMKRAGFQTIRMGLESSSDLFHDRTGRKTRLKDFLDAVRNLSDVGFTREQIGVYLLVGLPGQTRGRIESDVEVVLQAGAHPKLAEYSPIPGTALWPDALQNSRFPIDEEPLYQNCTLLATAEPGIDWEFLRKTRRRIRETLDRDTRSRRQ